MTDSTPATNMELESTRPINACDTFVVSQVTQKSNSDTNNDANNDANDAPPSSCKITNCDIFFLVFSIITHVIDVGIDITLAVRYYYNDKMNMFAWTVALILLPSLVNTIVSLKMHQQDREVTIY